MLKSLHISYLSLIALLSFVLTACQPANPSNQQLSSGLNHSCSLDPLISGVQCWGDNRLGQTLVPDLNEAVLLSSGDNFNCAVTSQDVVCWGDNSAKQLDPPKPLTGSINYLAAGSKHACFAAGTVQCWGDNQSGQIEVPSLLSVTGLALGSSHSCAISDKQPVCWGDSQYGQLEAPQLPAQSEVLAIKAGGNTSCVLYRLRDKNRVQCWGEAAALANQTVAMESISAISLNADNLCVLNAGQAWCGGGNQERLKPRDLTMPMQIALGQNHVCARHQQGVACWGDNTYGQSNYNGGDEHTLYRSEIVINALPDEVWGVLMDLEHYPLWNPFTIEMKSELQKGGAMDMKVAMQPWLVLDQTEYIRILEPNYKACWGINTDTGAYSRGERCQWLEQVGPNQTRYITEDLIEGKLTPLISALFGNSLKSGFDGVAKGLKERVESLH